MRLKHIDGVSASSEGLPIDIVERQAAQALGQLRKHNLRGALEQARWPTTSPGTCVFLRAVFRRCVAGFSALGRLGLPAEDVADQAIDGLLAYRAPREPSIPTPPTNCSPSWPWGPNPAATAPRASPITC